MVSGFDLGVSIISFIVGTMIWAKYRGKEPIILPLAFVVILYAIGLIAISKAFL